PPVPSVVAEPLPRPEPPAAEPPTPSDELLCPPPADVPPVPSVVAEPLPEPEPAAEPPVPSELLLVPPPADGPPAPSVVLDCACTSATLPTRNVAASVDSLSCFSVMQCSPSISPLLALEAQRISNGWPTPSPSHAFRYSSIRKTPRSCRCTNT